MTYLARIYYAFFQLLTFSISDLLAASDQSTYPSHCAALHALVKSRKKDSSSDYVPAFSNLVTRRISLWFFPMVFDGIPSHFIPPVWNGKAHLDLQPRKSFLNLFQSKMHMQLAIFNRLFSIHHIYQFC